MITFYYEKNNDYKELRLPMSKKALEKKLNTLLGYKRISYSLNGCFLSKFIDKKDFDIRQFNSDLLKLRQQGVYFTPAFLATASVFYSNDFNYFTEQILQKKITCVDVTDKEKNNYTQATQTIYDNLYTEKNKEIMLPFEINNVLEQLQDAWIIATAFNKTFLVRSVV